MQQHQIMKIIWKETSLKRQVTIICFHGTAFVPLKSILPFSSVWRQTSRDPSNFNTFLCFEPKLLLQVAPSSSSLHRKFHRELLLKPPVCCSFLWWRELVHNSTKSKSLALLFTVQTFALIWKLSNFRLCLSHYDLTLQKLFKIPKCLYAMWRGEFKHTNLRLFVC